MTSVLDWHLPRFDTDASWIIRSQLTQKYALLALVCTTTILCIIIPLWHHLSLTKRFFKISHHLRHHILTRRNLGILHNAQIYHNQSFHLFAFWFTFVAVATLYHTNGDLIQITKRLGRIAVAMMPPLLFLTLRPSPLPHILYLSLLPFHKWISRIVVLASLAHSILYIWYMHWAHRLAEKIWKPANVHGIIAMFLFIAIAVTSLRVIRRKNFRLFYYIHYSSTWLAVILIYFHARPGVPYYTAINCTILLYQIAYRVYHTRKTTVTVFDISPNLTLLEFPLNDLVKKPTLPAGHVRINAYHKNFIKRWLYHIVPFQHPFTIASLPTDDPVRLIIRKGRFQTKTNCKYFVTGTYEPMIDFISKPKRFKSLFFSYGQQDDLRPNTTNPFQINSSALLQSPLNFNINARRVLMCVGGSAIAVALPLLRIFNFNGVNVRLIWASRDYRDLQVLNHFTNNFEGLEIYISGSSGNEQDIQIDYFDFDYPSPSIDHEEEQLSSCAIPESSESTAIAIGSSAYGATSKTARTTTIGTPNFESIADTTASVNSLDEIDFTETFSAKNVNKLRTTRSEENLKKTVGNGLKRLTPRDVFRKPIVIELPTSSADSPHVGATPKTKKIKVPSGVKVFFGRPSLTNADYNWCLQKECIGPSETNECCHPNFENSSHVDDLAKVWVLAAGPHSLIENSRRWATDGGLHFYAESFAV